MIPISPEDWKYLAYRDSNGRLCVDTRLVFGLASACRLFSAFGLVICWILFFLFGVLVSNYVDDYLYASENEELSRMEVELGEITMRLIGCKTKDSKRESGKIKMTALGILFDSHELTMGLPEKKRAATARLVDSFLLRDRASASELATLNGNLAWAARLFRGGSVFQTRSFATLAAANKITRQVGRPTCIPLGSDFKADLVVWRWLLANTNETKPLRLPAVELDSFTDASGRRIGGVVGRRVWALDRRDPRCAFLVGADIGQAEMAAVACQVQVFRKELAGRHCRFAIDNSADFHSLQSGRNKNVLTQHWLRVVTLLSFLCNFTFETYWVKSSDNPIADALTRMPMAEFLRTHPQYEEVPNADIPALPSPNAGVGWESSLIAALGTRSRSSAGR